MNTEEKDLQPAQEPQTHGAEQQKSIYDLSDAELAERSQKRIEITPLDESLNTEFLRQMHNILKLRAEVIERINIVQGFHTTIMEDLAILKNSPVLTIKEDAAKPFEESYKKFEQFAHTFLGEIEYHLAIYAQHIQDSPPTHAVVPKQAPDSFEQLIRFGSSFLKVFVKKRKKEIALFFSRYEHTYKKQYQRIEQLKRVHESASSHNHSSHTHQHNPA